MTSGCLEKKGEEGGERSVRVCGEGVNSRNGFTVLGNQESVINNVKKNNNNNNSRKVQNTSIEYKHKY